MKYVLKIIKDIACKQESLFPWSNKLKTAEAMKWM